MKKRWDKEEIKILKENYRIKSRGDLCDDLPNRTWQAIKIKAYLIGITNNQYKTVEQRFWNFVDKKEVNKCWNWIGHCDNKNYGRIQINGKSFLAHRFSYELFFGKIPKNKPCVLHHCDNSLCVNPNHLFVGTQADNIKDKVKKSRQAKGESVWCSKLTLDQVKQIRRLCSEGKLLQREIAKIFNIDHANVSLIYRNKTWRNHEGEKSCRAKV